MFLLLGENLDGGMPLSAFITEMGLMDQLADNGAGAYYHPWRTRFVVRPAAHLMPCWTKVCNMGF